MQLGIRPAWRNEDGSFDPGGPTLQGSVSWEGSDLSLEADRTGGFSGEVVAWLRDRLGEEEHRGWLQERWRRSRGQTGDPGYPSGIPPRDVDGLDFFDEEFPYDFDLMVFHEGRGYLAADQYCLAPGCPCHEAVVCFVELENRGRSLGAVRAPVRRLHRARVIDGPTVIRRLWSALPWRGLASRAGLLRGHGGPEATILDGSRRDSSVVVMTHHETRKAVLEGFTVTGGTGSRFKTDHRQYGGGIHCLGASPTIRGNWIVDNQGFEAGGIGIGPDVDMVPPAPLVEGNLIARNYAPLDGGGMALGDCNAEIRSNVFDSNQAHADGAGIWYWATNGNPVIEGNQFVENVAGDHGGGIYLGGNHALTQVSVEENLFVRNRTIGTGFFGDTGSGAAIAALQTDGVIAHNTIVDNDGHHLTLYGGGGLLLWQTRLGMIVQDNIIVDNQQCGIACWDRGTTATMRRNLVWHNSGGTWDPDMEPAREPGRTR